MTLYRCAFDGIEKENVLRGVLIHRVEKNEEGRWARVRNKEPVTKIMNEGIVLALEVARIVSPFISINLDSVPIDEPTSSTNLEIGPNNEESTMCTIGESTTTDLEIGSNNEESTYVQNSDPNNIMHVWRTVAMIILTGLFFIIELVTGIIIGSIALQSDAFHMLSDLCALIISLYAQVIKNNKATNNATFGMVRSEIIGGLTNSVFLLATCFYIIIETIQRFIKHGTENVDLSQINLLIIVGAIGLFINLFKSFLIISIVMNMLRE